MDVKIEKKHFDSMAKEYEENYGYNDDFTKYKMKKKISKLVDIINSKRKSKSGLNILEVGCGTGAYTKIVASQLKKDAIFAFDLSSGMVEVAKRSTSEKNINYFVKIFRRQKSR